MVDATSLQGGPDGGVFDPIATDARAKVGYTPVRDKSLRGLGTLTRLKVYLAVEFKLVASINCDGTSLGPLLGFCTK